MKSTGIIRKLDALGRLVIPKEIRKIQGWRTSDPIELYVNNDEVIIRKYNPYVCPFCNAHINSEYIYCPSCGAEQLNGEENL